MMTYKTLSAKRKVVVDALLKEYPTITKSGVISYKEIQDFWDKVKGDVSEGKRPFGYPLWITIEKDCKTETRGVYRLPLPNSKEVLTPLPKPCKVVDEVVYTNEEYEATLIAAGIKPKKRKG
jgi:hypothetical protein